MLPLNRRRRLGPPSIGKSSLAKRPQKLVSHKLKNPQKLGLKTSRAKPNIYIYIYGRLLSKHVEQKIVKCHKKK